MVASASASANELSASGLETPPKSFDWTKESSLNNLNDVYQLYCQGALPLKKHLREIFTSGSMDDVKCNFQELMTYCANDVKATYSVFCHLWPQFKTRFPHPVTLGGMLEMGVSYLPVNKNWERYIEKSQSSYASLQHQLNSVLFKLASDAAFLHPNRYQDDVWLWNLDWSTKKLKVDSSLLDKAAYSMFSSHWKSNMSHNTVCKTTSINCPRWFADLCDHNLQPTKLTVQRRVTPKLLRLLWDGFPLHFDAIHGWGYLVPRFDYTEEELTQQDDYATSPDVIFPLKSLQELCSRLKPDWFNQISAKHATDKLVDDILVELQRSTGNEEDIQKQWEKLNQLKYSYKDHVNFNHSGQDPFMDVVPGCLFYRLPHKDGSNKRVGNPLAKDFIGKIEQGILQSDLGSDAEAVLKFGNMCSYWKNNVDRICSQMVVRLPANCLPSAVVSHVEYDRTKPYMAIIPRIVTAGTVTRRAVEPTWLTASNAYEDRVGSELKAMIQAPPGYNFVGADVDSQELWIAALLGDNFFHGVHGCTAFGWMTLQGSKVDGTDLHSRTAKLVGISREHAKVFNYGRIYGAGQKFAEQLLMKFNHRLTHTEAHNKAKAMFLATKGRRIRLSDLDHRNKGTELSEMQMSKWQGGSESHMFNMLEHIARSSEPRTPVLNCLISKALEPRNVHSEFMTSRINWVVQSSAVDYLHLMLVCMRWLLDEYRIDGRFCISIHDEVRYMVQSDDRYRAALALQITNLLTRSMFAYKLGFDDLPLSVAFFSAVDIDICLRKEASMDCITPSNPDGLCKGYSTGPGESLSIHEILGKTVELVKMPNVCDELSV